MKKIHILAAAGVFLMLAALSACTSPLPEQAKQTQETAGPTSKQSMAVITVEPPNTQTP